MKRSHAADLLGRLTAEFERLEAKCAAAVARSRELSGENASLRSRLHGSDVGLPPFIPDVLRPQSTFDEPWRPGTSESRFAFAENSMDMDAIRLSRPLNLVTEADDVPTLGVPMHGTGSSTPRVTSRVVTPQQLTSPRCVASSHEAPPSPQGPEDSSPLGSPRPETIRTPDLPSKEPAVLQDALACRPKRSRWSAKFSLWRHSVGPDDAQHKPSMFSWASKRSHSHDAGLASEDPYTRFKSRKLVGAIGQFRRASNFLRPSMDRGRTFDFNSMKPTNLANNPRFEWAFSMLIFCNAIVMALEAQYKGFDSCISARFPGCSRPARELWPGAEEAFFVLNWIFGVLFTVEFVIKVIALKIDFVKSVWNLFDMAVVTMWLIEKILSSMIVNSQIVRLGRMARLVRLARMVKFIQAFDSLQVLLGSIQASASALFWSSCLLVLIQMIVGLALHNLLQDHMSDPSVPEVTRQQVFGYFGSFSRSMISMFELTLANWPQICWTLVDKVSEWYGLIVLTYKLVVGFAILVVVTGVFLHETFKVASSDDDLMLVQKQRATKNHVEKMERLFKEADTSCDGLIDRDEFKRVLMIDKVRTWLAAMELEVSDPDLLFDFLDDGDEAITVAELIDGVARLKGSARNIDVVALMHNINKIFDIIEDMQAKITRVQKSLGSSADVGRARRTTCMYGQGDRNESTGLRERSSFRAVGSIVRKSLKKVHR